MTKVSIIPNLMAAFLDFAEGNAEVKAMHIALYAHILTTIRMRGENIIALPTEAAMHRTRITSKAYYSYLADLVKWGVINCNPDPALRHTLSYAVSVCEALPKQT